MPSLIYTPSPVNMQKQQQMPGRPSAVSLTKMAIENELVFRLSDNGIGKQNNTGSKDTGFGTELVNLLVQQIEGILTADISNGTTINIHFKNRKPH